MHRHFLAQPASSEAKFTRKNVGRGGVDRNRDTDTVGHSPLHSIKETSNGSGRSTEASDQGSADSQQAQRSNAYVDPYAPRQHSPLSPTIPRSDGASD